MMQSQVDGEDIIVKFERHLDETVQFPAIKPKLSQRIVFECEALFTLTSFGLQKWVGWIRSFDPRQQFVFRNCHSRIVHAFNTVHAFIPCQAIVESFYWPLYCAGCSHDEEILLVRGKEYLEAQGEDEKTRFLQPDVINCPKCREPMEEAILEQTYLKFLQIKKKE